MTVASDIDNAVHLLCQHVLHCGMNKGKALFLIPGAVSIPFVKPQIAENIVKAGIITGLRNTVNDFRGIKDCKVFGNNPYGPALPFFQIARI